MGDVDAVEPVAAAPVYRGADLPQGVRDWCRRCEPNAVQYLLRRIPVLIPGGGMAGSVRHSRDHAATPRFADAIGDHSVTGRGADLRATLLTNARRARRARS